MAGPLRLSGRRRVLALGGYALVSFLCFPHPVAGGVLDLGWLLAWLAPGLLWLGVGDLAPRRAAWLGGLAGLLAHSLILHWIFVVTVFYGEAPFVVGLLAPVILALYIAFFTATAAAGAAWLGARRLASPFALAALWTVVDHLRASLWTGFPWATLGYAQHLNPGLMGLAPYTGVYGLSFVTVLGSSALLAVARDRRGTRATALALAAVAAAHLPGALVEGGDAGAETVRIAVVQGNIDQGVKWSPEWAQRTLEIYEELSRGAAGEGAELIVWPETAVPGAVELDDELRARLSRLARETGATLVVGAVGLEPAPQPGGLAYFDSAFAVEPEAGFVDRYDKTHLVPFGEYVPAGLRWVVSAVARGVAPVGVTPGDRPRGLELALPGRSLRAGIPICYELLFPDLVRRFVADGAAVLLGITNDAWYGRTGAPFQFLAITALRSAEGRVWTARAANTGVSAFIDARGRVRVQTPIFERGYRVADVPLRPPPRGGSFYTRHGDLFAAGCWIGVLALGILGRHRSPGEPT